ncbi:MAG: PEP-CTERM sorting domain-containing protein [Acidobacteriota bacterium]
MKTLALFVFAISCHASPITFYSADAYSNAVPYTEAVNLSASGGASATEDGWYLSLYNVPGQGLFQDATFTSDEALIAWGGYFDNSPLDFGTGMYVYADDVFIGSFGRGYTFTGFWGFQQGAAFTKITIRTGVRANGLLQEHLMLKTMIGGEAPGTPIHPESPIINILTETPDQLSSVPEPATFGLVGILLIGIGLLKRRATQVPK